MFSWPARVVSHVGQSAVVQVPGGLLLVDDVHGALRDGQETEVHGSDPTYAFKAVWFELYASTQVGPVAVLQANLTGQQTPLLLRTGENLPRLLVLSIRPDDAPVIDDDQAKPFCDSQPNCCPDASPDHIDQLLPCCVPDIDPLGIDALLPPAPPATACGPNLLSFLDSLFPSEPSP